MTISNTNRTAGPFTGNGTSKQFPFSFKVFSRSDLLVARTVISTAVESILLLDADYTVTLNGSQNTNPGGVITLASPLPVGTILAATSNLPIQQNLDLTNNGGFYPAAINDALDRIVITIQQLAAKVGVGALNIGAGAAIATVLAFIGNIASSSGASLVGFIQSGFGAVKRTLQDKSRDFIDARDYGATGLGLVDDADAILQAKTYAESAGKTLRLSGGIYLCSKDIILNPNTSIHGDGMATTQIKFTGTAAMKSARTVCDYVDLRDFWIQQGGTGLIGLDIGTLRRSTVQNVRVWEYLIGFNLDIGVASTANYWNRLINCEAAGPGKTFENSVGFNLGNNINVSYPDTDYNVLIGCKSFTYQTGVRLLNAIGCQITSHQCTEVTTGLQIFSGNNNSVEMMVENSTNMGFADVNTIANKICLYNDGGNATAFQDNGINYVTGQLLAYPTLSNPARELDGFLKDRVFFGGVAASMPFFQLNMDGVQGVAAVEVAYTGFLAGKLNIAGVAVWDVLKVGTGGAPKAILRSISGASDGAASFNGTVMTTTAGQFSVGQTITAAGVPIGTTIVSFTSGGGATGTVANISNNVGALGARPVNGADTIFSVAGTSDGLVKWTAAGDATTTFVLNAIVKVQGITGLEAYPYSRAIRYTRLVS